MTTNRGYSEDPLDRDDDERDYDRTYEDESSDREDEHGEDRSSRVIEVTGKIALAVFAVAAVIGFVIGGILASAFGGSDEEESPAPVASSAAPSAPVTSAPAADLAPKIIPFEQLHFPLTEAPDADIHQILADQADMLAGAGYGEAVIEVVAKGGPEEIAKCEGAVIYESSPSSEMMYLAQGNTCGGVYNLNSLWSGETVEFAGLVNGDYEVVDKLEVEADVEWKDIEKEFDAGLPEILMQTYSHVDEKNIIVGFNEIEEPKE